MLRESLKTIQTITVSSIASDSFMVNLPNNDFHSLVAKFTVQSFVGAQPLADVYIQTTDDKGTTFYDLAHFTQVSATGEAAATPIWAVLPCDGGEGKYVGVAADATIAAGTVTGLPIMDKKLKFRWVLSGDAATDMQFKVDLYSHSEEPR